MIKKFEQPKIDGMIFVNTIQNIQANTTSISISVSLINNIQKLKLIY